MRFPIDGRWDFGARNCGSRGRWVIAQVVDDGEKVFAHASGLMIVPGFQFRGIGDSRVGGLSRETGK